MPEDIILVLPCNTSNLKITFRASRGFPFCWSIWRYINKRSYMNTGNRSRVKKTQKSPRKINKHRITLKTWNSFLKLWTLLATLLALFPGFNPFSVLWQFQNHQHGITHKIKPYNRNKRSLTSNFYRKRPDSVHLANLVLSIDFPSAGEEERSTPIVALHRQTDVNRSACIRQMLHCGTNPGFEFAATCPLPRFQMRMGHHR